MKQIILRTITALLFWLGYAATATVQAQSLLLIQGYASDGSDWHTSGVTSVLYSAGWDNGGHLVAGPRGVESYGAGPMRGEEAFYTVALPTEAPLHIQMGYLERYIEVLTKRAPEGSIYLAGHSIGGCSRAIT